MAWPFDPLASRQRVDVAVRVWGPDGASDWSAPLRVEAGLLAREDWSARLVQPPRTGDDACAYLRREFDADTVVRARLYATAQGVYECRLNGVPVGPDRLAPGWTSYRHRLRYQVHDVTDLVRTGANALAVRLADGWFAGRLGWWRGGLRHLYGERTGVVVQLELTHADGTVRTVTSDGAWRAGHGGITATSFYDGETYVADDEPAGWELPGFDDAAWAAVDVAGPAGCGARRPAAPGDPGGRLDARARVAHQPVGGHDRGLRAGAHRARAAAAARRPGQRRHRAVRGGARRAASSRCGPQRTAANTDRVTLGSSGELDWEPTFTFRSFRYAAIDDPGGVVVRDEVTGRMVRNDLARTGWFECSDPELDRLHENAVWGIADNMLDVPTDCMLRDERLGWIGDAAHVARAAAYLYDTVGLPRLVARGPRARPAPQRQPDDGGARDRARAVPRRLPGRGVRRRRVHGARRGVRAVRRPGPAAPPAPVDGGVGAVRGGARCSRASPPRGSSSATGSTRPPRRTTPRTA